MRPLLPVAVVAVLPPLPFVNNYILAATVRALIFIALGQAWNIVAGIGGQLSLGHGVFLGLGCYVTGILFNELGVPPWIGVWAGALVVARRRVGDGQHDAAHARRVLRAGDRRRLAGIRSARAPLRRSDRRRQRAGAEFPRQFAVGDAIALAGTVRVCRSRASSSSITGSRSASSPAASVWRCARCATMRSPRPRLAFACSAPSCWDFWSAPR